MAGPDGFLNVDLEVGARARAQLTPLVEALEGTLFELWRGRIRGLYRAHYEVSSCVRNASATLHALASAIDALTPRARRSWNAASLRDFNIGVELARGVKNIELALDPEAVSRVSALGGRIVFTAYQVAAMERRKRGAVGAVIG